MSISFPALFVVAERRCLSLPVAGDALIGRSPESILSVADPACSRRQFAIEVRGEGRFIVPLSRRSGTWVDQVELVVETYLRHGARIRFGEVLLVYLAHEDSDLLSRSGDLDASLPTAHRTILATASRMSESSFANEIGIEGEIVLGRDPGPDGVRLDHPMVSRRHVLLRLEGSDRIVRDLGSANGSFVNGVRVDGEAGLDDGDQLQVGPFRFECRGDRLIPRGRSAGLHLVARDLIRWLPGPQAERRLLDDVSLVVKPGSFVVLIGASGSGKSMLLNALSARQPADSGRVTIDGVDLYAHFESLKSQIALVPQRELLHEDLKLEEALRYTARLRLPPDSDEAAIAGAVDAALEAVELLEKRDAVVARLSGGQKRRAALANEIVCRPRLLFIDEATSGLDEQSDQEMMRLFRKLADSGVVVICVTHTLAHVEDHATALAVMAPGGRLVFYGRPEEARSFFGVEKLSEVYPAIERRGVDRTSSDFDASPIKAREIDTPLLGLEERKPLATPPPPPDLRLATLLPEVFRQLRILLSRYLKTLAADRKAIVAALAQCLIVALALHLAFDAPKAGSHQERSFAFLLGVSCFWFGCNNAAREIVKERELYLRERDVRLSVMAYVGSKAIVLGGFGMLQALLLWILAGRLDGIPGNAGLQLAFMAASALAATMLGLLLSAATRSSDQATTLVPIALIPQVVFSGHVNPDLPEAARNLARFLVCDYGVNRGMQDAIQNPAATSLVLEELGITLAHAIVAFIAAFLVLLLRDARDQRIYGHAIRAWADEARAGLEKAAEAAGRAAGRARDARGSRPRTSEECS